MKINLCRDPALVTSWCWRLRTRRAEYFLWRTGWRIRTYRLHDTHVNGRPPGS